MIRRALMAVPVALLLVIGLGGVANAARGNYLISQHLHTYYLDAVGGFVGTEAEATEKVNVTTREWSSCSGCLVENVDGAATIYDLGDPFLGNVQIDDINLYTFGSNLLRAVCNSGCPDNSLGGASVSGWTGYICVSPFGSGAYYTKADVSWRYNGVLHTKSLNSNATSATYSTVGC